MKKSESDDAMLWPLIIIVVLLLCIAYVVSLGEFTFSREDIDAEIKRHRDDLKEQHRMLNEVIKQKEVIRDQRLKWCKRVYFAVRFGIVLFGGGVIYILIATGLIGPTFSEILSLLGGIALSIIVLGFLFKTMTSLQEVVSSIKESFENVLYGQYRSIHKEIEDHYLESRQLEQKINELDKKAMI